MRIFEIYINNAFVCRAGLPEANAVITAIVTSRRRLNTELVSSNIVIEEKLDLSVGGYDCKSERNIEWLIQQLSEGDEILIKIKNGECDDLSPPREAEPFVNDTGQP